ncbi:MAG: hypothetical protein ABI632_07470 [Pseudolysinimonas sp.]
MTRTPLLGLAAAALLALSLAGCSTPAADTSTGSDGSSDSSPSAAKTGDAYTDDTSDGTLVTLGGSGDYTVGVTAPVGEYELTGKPSTQPSGCTWALEDESGNTMTQDAGPTLTITADNKFFQTSGCPDWVQTK